MRTARIWFVVLAVACLCGAALTELAYGVQVGLANMVFMDLSSQVRQEGVMTEEQWRKLCNDVVPHIRGVVKVDHGVAVLWLIVALLSLKAFFQTTPASNPETGAHNGGS